MTHSHGIYGPRSVDCGPWGWVYSAETKCRMEIRTSNMLVLSREREDIVPKSSQILFVFWMTIAMNHSCPEGNGRFLKKPMRIKRQQRAGGAMPWTPSNGVPKARQFSWHQIEALPAIFRRWWWVIYIYTNINHRSIYIYNIINYISYMMYNTKYIIQNIWYQNKQYKIYNL